VKTSFARKKKKKKPRKKNQNNQRTRIHGKVGNGQHSGPPHGERKPTLGKSRPLGNRVQERGGLGDQGENRNGENAKDRKIKKKGGALGRSRKKKDFQKEIDGDRLEGLEDRLQKGRKEKGPKKRPVRNRPVRPHSEQQTLNLKDEKKSWPGGKKKKPRQNSENGVLLRSQKATKKQPL